MTTQDSIKFHHDLNSIIREGAKAKGIEKSAARRLTEDAVGAFEESYLELRRDQRRCTRAIRVIDYPEGGKKKVKKLDKKATKERAAQLEVRAAVQAKFVGIHRAFKKFCQGRIDAAKGVAAAKKYLGVKLSTKAFEALAALWAKHAGFESKEEHAAKAPSRKAAKAKKPAKKARKTRKVKDDESSDDESSDDESSDDESSDESDDDEKPAKRKLAKKPAKKEKKVARVKPTKKRVVEDSDESDDSSDDDSSDDDSSDDSSDDESDDSSD